MTTKATSLLLNVAYEWETIYASAAFSGIVGDLAHTKTGGYHISIEDNSPTNYSVVRPDDKAPPGDWSRIHATALDMSMNKADMILSTRRFMVVWSDRTDPRRKYLNAFNGWTGSGDAQRWDFVTNTVQKSTNDHQWHHHGEIRRKYWNDQVAHNAYLSVARGDTKEQWIATGGEGGDDMFANYGDKGEKVIALQNQLLQLDSACLPQFGPDGGYGDETANALSRLVTGGPGKVYQGDAWAKLQKLCQQKNGGGGAGGLVQHTHTIESQSVFVAGSKSGPAVQS